MSVRHTMGLAACVALAVTGALAVAEGARGAEVPVLERGDRGAQVRFYQDELNAWLRIARPESGRLNEDGIFGPRTEAATRELERAAGIAVDGVADRATWDALYRLLGNRATELLRPAQVVPEWPIPVPGWFWEWGRWYLHRGEFRDEPFRSRASRPDAAPIPIPEWAWRRMNVLNGRPPVERAEHFVEDRVQAIFGRGGRLSEGQVDVTPQRRSELAPGWVLLTASFERASGSGSVAAWLRLVRGRWVPWEIGRLGAPGFESEPSLVPCDLKPAFAEAFCGPATASGPGTALQAFTAAARAGDAGRLFALLTPAAQERFGPLETFRQGTATELAEGLGSFPAGTETVLATRVGGEWGVAAIAGERTVEGTREYGAYATALRLVGAEWRVALGGPVALEPLEPAPGATVDAARRIAVRATAPSALDAFEVWLDGTAFPTEGGGPSAREQTEFGQPREPLAAGRHVVVAFARAGETATARAWTFTVR